jgi:hypothetical protein
MISQLSGYRLPKVLTPEARLENPVRAGDENIADSEISMDAEYRR